ncbi:hypothetical protein DCM91_02395 [Chitinophaga costaii]|nr:hypothetical protein DCM91_02395 [Chitinophaga costaii]
MLSSQEASEVEATMAQFPEVRAQVEACRLDMESYIGLQAITPPPSIKASILARLSAEEEEAANGPSTDPAAPAPAFHMAHGLMGGNKPLRHVVDAKWRLVAVIFIVLLIGSLAFNYVYLNNYSNLKGKYDALLLAQARLTKDNESYQTKLQQYSDELALMRDPNFQPIRMLGLKGHEGNIATIYWNAKSQDVYLLSQNLPQPAADKQYQLWAIVAGKPVSAGVFTVSNMAKGLQKMKSMVGMQAFEVTLEQAGGAAAPTLSQLFVMGKVGS